METFGDLGIEEGHVEFSYDHLESHTSVSNEGLKKQCIEKSNLIQPIESQSDPTSSHSKFAYDLEQPRAYAKSYHPTSLFDIYDGVCNPLHHTYMYISPIQAWIEEACGSAC